MDKTPLISVITINFNDRVGLERTFESVFNQTFQDFEYIVIDGGSNDGSKELIEQNTEKISYWISEPDKGIYNAMNKGISVAKGDYLLFLNSGDILYKNDVLKSCETYLCNEDIISGNLSFVENERNWLGKTPETLSFYRFFTDTLYHPCSFIKKTAFDTFGGYDEEYKICSDWKWFLLAICKKKATYKHIEITISAFFVDGISSQNTDLVKKERDEILLKEFPSFIQDYAVFSEFKKKQFAVKDLENKYNQLLKSRLIKFFKIFGFFKNFNPLYLK